VIMGMPVADACPTRRESPSFRVCPVADRDATILPKLTKGGIDMRRFISALGALVLASLVLGSVAAASTPPGQRGYEGQPGNQGWQHSN